MTNPDALTRQEVNALCLSAAGLTNREIAHRLRYAPSTVPGILKSARQKLHANNTTHATWLAFFAGDLCIDDLHAALQEHG
jgi:DNA-binding CsgD family transcriptional regulator